MSNFAFIFPGQGSQSVGMADELIKESAVARSTFEEAADALGYDLSQLIAQGPEEQLNQTDKTQPAILTMSVAIYRCLQEQGVELPLIMAGHSLGEYSALVSAGVIGFSYAVKLVEKRGQFMQQAVPEGTGAMSAIIGLEDQLIAKACAEAEQGEVVSPVNYNSPGQVVIAGNVAAVARANELCLKAGAKKAMPLPVSVPSHCQLMQPAAEKLSSELTNIQFNKPSVEVINNVDVAVMESESDISAALVKQLFSPVRWTETIQSIAERGIDTLYEVGPGKVLTGLCKRIDRSLSCSPINTIESIKRLAGD